MPAPKPATETSKLPVHRLESPDGRLAIQYAWVGDRFSHQVLVDGRVCLSSVDGDATESWPASPPIQDVSLEPIQNVPMILGVGGAGSGHWSISVGWRDDTSEPAATTRADATHAKPGTFLFDIACRSKQPPIFLGSTYRHESAEAPMLVIQAAGDAKLTTSTDQRSQITDQRSQITVTANLDPSAATHRWIYSIGLGPGHLSRATSEYGLPVNTDCH